MKQLPSGEGSRNELAKILDEYMSKNDIQPNEYELAVALDVFRDIIKNLKKSKE